MDLNCSSALSSQQSVHVFIYFFGSFFITDCNTLNCASARFFGSGFLEYFLPVSRFLTLYPAPAFSKATGILRLV